MMGRFGLGGRIVLVTGVIGTVAILSGAVALVANARQAIGIEVAATRDLARDYVLATIGAYLRDNEPEGLVAFLPDALIQPRHASIAVFDRSSGVTLRPAAPTADAEAGGAPAWFRAYLAPTPAETVVPIRVGLRTFGDVVVTADPHDEIDEIWRDFRTLAVIVGTTFLLTLLTLWVLVQLTLRPLVTMTRGIDSLGSGDFTTRIGKVGVPDLALLAERFDALAGELQQTLSEKDALNRRLVSVQDEERKIIARELHDEFGPCLFGLKVEAHAILEEAEQLKADQIAASARSLLAIAAQIEGTNDDLLARLRPMELDELPLSQVLEDLVDGLRTMAPGLEWRVDIAQSLTRYDETSSLTIYRVVQEAVTNVLRHSGATMIHVAARQDPARGDWAELLIDDNGMGLSASAGSGSGLRGMRERIEALAGRLCIGPGPDGGLRVSAEVPLMPWAGLGRDYA